MVPRSEPVVPPSFAAVVDAYIEFLDDALDTFFDWNEDHRWNPADSSPFLVERSLICRQNGPSGDWGPDESQNVLGIASLLLGVSTQYLEAIRALLAARQMIVSLPPLVRSTLEASCRIVWLLAPIGASDRPELYQSAARPRVARAVLIQLEDVTRAKTAAVALGDPGAPKYGSVAHRVKKKRIPGVFYGSEIVRHDNGDLSLCGQRLPGLRGGVLEYERILGEDWRAGGAYDYLSNASHPTPHIAIYITRKSQTDGLVRFELEDPSYLARLVRLAVVPVLQAWRMTATYLGLPADAIDSLLDRVDGLDT